MRDVTTKQDNTGDTLDAATFNSNQNELENVVRSANIALDPAGGPDNNVTMLAQAINAYANAGASYADSGTANVYVLQLSTSLHNLTTYYDNMRITFKVGNTNTGASTVNITSLGVRSITRSNGSALTGGELTAGKYVTLVYNLSDSRFELSGIQDNSKVLFDSGWIDRTSSFAAVSPWTANVNFVYLRVTQDSSGIYLYVYAKNTSTSNPAGQNAFRMSGSGVIVDLVTPDSSILRNISSLGSGTTNLRDSWGTLSENTSNELLISIEAVGLYTVEGRFIVFSGMAELNSIPTWAN